VLKDPEIQGRAEPVSDTASSNSISEGEGDEMPTPSDDRSKAVHFIKSVGLIKGLIQGKHNRSLKVAVRGPVSMAHPLHTLHYISWRRVFSFMPQLLYLQGKSPGTHWIGG
jgi:hypothetical protein